MSVKFKIAFDIDAEVLFGMLAKMLPIENLSVEELTPPAPKPAQPLLVKQLIRHLDHLPQPSKIMKQVAKVKLKREPRRPLTLHAGINRIIMDLLSDSKSHSAIEMKPLVKANGFSANSVGSRLQQLEAKGYVTRVGDGEWKMTVNAFVEYNSIPVVTNVAGQK